MKSMKKMAPVLVVVLGALFMIIPHKKFLVFGHRGACGYEPENTMSSFQKALDLGVDGIELDVYVCATGELVVMHDDTVDRTTNGQGSVVDMTFDQLRNLVVGGKEKIPTLQEVIDLVDKKVPINIELKGPGTAKPVADLLQNYVKKGWSDHDFVVSSFDQTQIAQFKRLYPLIKTGILFSWSDMPDSISMVAQHVGAHFIGLDVHIITKELIEQAHAAGFQIFVWAVNDRAMADKMRQMAVDGIFSNYPDKVR